MTSEAASLLLHASAVAIDGSGIVLSGPSGSGKSDLALRLIAAGAVLIADDQLTVVADDGIVWLSAPRALHGRLHVHGLGILTFPTAENIPLRLWVEASERVEPLPSQRQFRTVAGVPVPLLPLRLTNASTPVKIALAIRRLVTDNHEWGIGSGSVPDQATGRR
jgi:serine kinase of HPr protein (carbohydrate metabolism regulator)